LTSTSTGTALTPWTAPENTHVSDMTRLSPECRPFATPFHEKYCSKNQISN
jgi:hypothetical protein